LASLWLSQVARLLADNCLRIFVLLELAQAGGEQQGASWHLVMALFVTPAILFAPINGAVSNSASQAAGACPNKAEKACAISATTAPITPRHAHDRPGAARLALATAPTRYRLSAPPATTIVKNTGSASGACVPSFSITLSSPPPRATAKARSIACGITPPGHRRSSR
jgi:hypothetical protein